MPEWVDSLARVAVPLAIVGLFIWLSVSSGRSEAVVDGPEDEPYRVYSAKYDLELAADQVVAGLPEASPDSERGHVSHPAEWTRAIADAEARLAEMPLIFGSEAALARLQEASSGLEPHHVVVALLIDQSGSMKGPSMAEAVAAAAFVTDLIQRFGARSEILGFTTAGWRGGYPRLDWLEAGRPQRPGRLCALMHVIYKSADEPILSDEARRVMVHPDLLRENVDGEAILWASKRLGERPERHKLLMVLSDGAPVDDSTLASNGPSYLYRHLIAVLQEIEAEGNLTIGGLGINHDTHAFYWLAETARTPEAIPNEAASLLGQMLRAAAERIS